MDVFAVVAVAFWSMLPAYVPNNVAVLAGGGPPIDGGRTLGGRRLLGDGKTWRGTIAGVAAGAALALALDASASAVWEVSGIDAVPGFPIAIVVALPLGAMLGDVVASFLKRRLDRERGAAVPGLDQLDFVVGALALAAAADYGWFASTFTGPVLLVVLVITPILHLSTNYAAFVLGLKDVPW
jgi:CDP-2,3-bis-(O-geranylgeranyl)-sn-glycerol synthase